VSPARQRLELDAEQRGRVAAGVAHVRRLEQLRKAHLRHERLGQVGRLVVVRTVCAVDRCPGLVGVLRGEDVLVDVRQPGELLVRGEPLDDEVAVLAEEGDLLARGRHLERHGWWRTERERRHDPTLTPLKSISQWLV
jgi:hypothetical protein